MVQSLRRNSMRRSYNSGYIAILCELDFYASCQLLIDSPCLFRGYELRWSSSYKVPLRNSKVPQSPEG